MRPVLAYSRATAYSLVISGTPTTPVEPR